MQWKVCTMFMTFFPYFVILVLNFIGELNQVLPFVKDFLLQVKWFKGEVHIHKFHDAYPFPIFWGGVLTFAFELFCL